jgi:zinc transporter ZupT
VLLLLLLGSIAGFTIFLGLPIALMGLGDRTKGFLSAFAVGILVFLIVDVLGHAWDQTTATVKLAVQGGASLATAEGELALMFIGITLGLLSLVVYERSYMGRGHEGVEPTKVSTMTALGIGAHNLSEGLAIGQSIAFGAVGLGIVLLAKVLFIGGLPTLFGTLLGSLIFSPEAYVFFLALAGGALVYVTMLMFNTGRRRYSSGLMMAGIFLGLSIGFVTDLIVTIGGA